MSASCRSVRGVCKVRVNDVNKCSSKRIKRPPESGDFRGCRRSFTLVESLAVIRFLTSSRHVTVRHGRKNRRLKGLSVYSHSIVRNSLQFVPVCRSLPQFVQIIISLKNCRKSMGSNMGHGFSCHSRQFRGPRWVIAQWRSRMARCECFLLRIAWVYVRQMR